MESMLLQCLIWTFQSEDYLYLVFRKKFLPESFKENDYN